MPNSEHMELIKRGAREWNAWRTQNESVEPDFTGGYIHLARLRGAKLRGAKFSGARLVYAVFRDADLQCADLSNTNLHGADLRGADLRGADLHLASLICADLRGADLRGANLHGADLNRTNLRQAKLYGADLHGTRFHGIHIFFAIVSKVIVLSSYIKRWINDLFLKRSKSMFLLIGLVTLFFLSHQFGFISLFKMFRRLIGNRFFVKKLIGKLGGMVFLFKSCG